MMPKYIAYVPATMELAIEIEADSEEEVREAIYQTDFRLIVEKGTGETAEIDIIQFEMHDHVTRGNLFSGVRNDIEIEEIEDDDDDEDED